MEVSVDSEPLTGAALDAETVGELVARIRNADDDRLVVAMRMDGREVDDDAVEELLATPLSAPGQLDMETASVHAIGAEALGQAANVLEETHRHHTTIAELLAGGKNAEAMELLNCCFAAWDVAKQALGQASHLIPDLDAADQGEQGPARLTEHLRDHLLRIRESMKIRDFVAVSDLIQYEMPAVADNWQRALVGLQHALLEKV